MNSGLMNSVKEYEWGWDEEDRRSISAPEDIKALLPEMRESLLWSGRKLLLEDYLMDRGEFEERILAKAEKLGLQVAIEHQLSRGEIQDPTYDRLRREWKACEHDEEERMAKIRNQIDDHLRALVQERYVNRVTEELWPRLRRDFPLTDLGSGERFVAEYQEFVRFCAKKNRWYLWGGQRWIEDDHNWQEAKKIAKKTVRRMKAEANERRHPEIGDYWKGAESDGRLRSILKAAALEPQIQIAPQEFDNRKWLLNCPNVTLRLDFQALRAYRHCREDYLTKMVPWPYDPKAQCLRWKRFLEEVTGGNRELQSFLQLVAGYAITGEIGEKCLFFLLGPGDSGKTTFLETIGAMLGSDYARTTDFKSFKKGYSGIRNDLARLQGVRFVAAAEAARDEQFDVVLIKRVTGDDTISARLLYREFEEFRPEFKIFLSSNFEPQLPADDDAVWRRFVVLPFDFPAEKKQHDLKDRFREEMPGILAWAVRGAWDYYRLHYSQRKPFKLPRCVQEANEQYRARCHELGSPRSQEKGLNVAKRLIQRFLEQGCERVPGEAETPENLLQAMKHWCDEHFEDSSLVTPNMLGRQLTLAGYEVVSATRGRVNMRLWKGIRIRR